MGFRRHERGATGPDGPSASRAWCFTAREPLFLRRGAPRRLNETGPEASRRGASPPANPCSFVVRHHVGWANRSTGPDGVVLHRPHTLVPSSTSTTPPISSKRTIPGTRAGFQEFSSPQKTKNVGPGAAPAAPRRHFPFSLSIGRDCPFLYIRGTVSILSYLILSYLALPCLLNFQKIKMERKTRFELATLALARRCSTPEPLPQQLLYNITF